MYDPTMIGRNHANPSVENRQPSWRLAAATCLALVLILGVVTQLGRAQTTMQLIRWREFSYVKETKQVAGRMAALDAVNRTGFLVLGDGQFARLSSWVVHTTTPDSREYYQGFVMYDFEDGSSILARVDGSGPPRPMSGTSEVSARHTGTITFIAGTKRYQGITGRGTVTSWRPAQWDMYAEIDATFSVSEP